MLRLSPRSPLQEPQLASCPAPDGSRLVLGARRSTLSAAQLQAGVCESGCGSARARVAGDPRGPRPREARAGEGCSLGALGCGASSALGVRFPAPPRESRAPGHPGSQLWPSQVPGACFCRGRLQGRGRGRQGRPARQLRDLFLASQRSSPRASPRRLELRGATAPSARSRPPRRRAEADPAVPRRRRGARPPAPGAHGGEPGRDR